MQTNNSGKSKVASAKENFTNQINTQMTAAGVVVVDPEEMTAIVNGHEAHIRSFAVPAFDPNSIASDRELASDLKEAKERLNTLGQRRDVMDARLISAREQTERIPAPAQIQTAVLLAAIFFFLLNFATTIQAVFFGGLDDAILAWVFSIFIGAGVGIFLTLLFLYSDGELPTTSLAKTPKFLGLLVGFGFGVLRISKAEGVEGYLIAFGLTLLEWAAVIGLDLYSQKRRRAVREYRVSQAQIIALEHAIAGIDTQIAQSRNAIHQLQDAVRQRELEVFDADLAAMEARCAAEAAYRGAINANRRALEGGAVIAFQPRNLQALGN